MSASHLGQRGREVELQMRLKDLIARAAGEDAEARAGDAGFGPFITVSRQLGSGGAEVARLVADELGWDLLDRELARQLAGELEVSPQMLALLDERRSSWLRDDVLGLLDSRLVVQDALVTMMARVVLLAACDGRVVVVGRGANFLLPPRGGLRVRLIAPLPHRVDKVMRREGLDRRDAERRIAQVDAEREDFVRRHFHAAASAPEHYDLILDTSRFSPVGAAELIRRALELIQDAT